MIKVFSKKKKNKQKTNENSEDAAAAAASADKGADEDDDDDEVAFIKKLSVRYGELLSAPKETTESNIENIECWFNQPRSPF